MLPIPFKGDLRVDHNAGGVGAARLGATVTTGGGTSATKGTAVQLIASTAFDAHWITILAQGYAAAAIASEGSLDILIGAATESILIADLLMGYCGGDLTTSADVGPKRWDFPLYIPAGSRIAAQAAGARLSTNLGVAVFLYGGQGYASLASSGSRVTTYGVSAPNGVTITPGASGGEGSWTEITASTSEDHFALIPSLQLSTDTTANRRYLFVDIGIGAATEEEIAQSFIFQTGSNEFMAGPYNSIPCMKPIPAGSRLTMRVSNNGTNDGPYNAAIHAVS